MLLTRWTTDPGISGKFPGSLPVSTQLCKCKPSDIPCVQMLTCLDDLSAGPTAVREPDEPTTIDGGLAGPDNEQEERQEVSGKGHVVIIGALLLMGAAGGLF